MSLGGGQGTEYQEQSLITLILKTKKWRLREMKGLAQGDSTGESQSGTGSQGSEQHRSTRSSAGGSAGAHRPGGNEVGGLQARQVAGAS